jgi:hypothetical protein
MDCAYCGKYLGEGRNNPREPESCGEVECNREVNAMYREMDEYAQEAARDDDYGRYR